jgi:hypothetical protein
MKRLTLEDIITGILLLLVLMGASFLSPPAEATPLYFEWSNTKGDHKGSFDLSDPEQRANFRETFKNTPKIRDCAARADYAVELMAERDDGTKEKYHLEVIAASYERTKNEPKGAVPWHIYVDFQRMVRDLHRHAGGEWLFDDADKHWDREFRWCYINAGNW